MSATIGPLEDFPAQPWRNNRGMTREIAVRSSSTGLLWRISLAQIDRDGPFSSFPGLTRHLALASSGTIVLENMEHRTVSVLSSLGDTVCFSGNDDIEGRCQDEKVRAFNLIARADVSAELVACHQITHFAKSEAIFLLPVHGDWKLSISPTILRSGMVAQLLGHSTEITITPLSEAAVLIAAVIP